MASMLRRFLDHVPAAGHDAAPLGNAAERAAMQAEGGLASMLDRARESGAQEERERSLAEVERRIAEATEIAEAKIRSVREQWSQELIDRVESCIREELRQTEQRLAAEVCEILEPFVATAARTRIVSSLSTCLQQLLGEAAMSTVRMEGPPDVLEALSNVLVKIGVRVEPSHGTEAVVVVRWGASLIKARLEPWARDLTACAGGM